jgi:hypothetical protein
MQTWKAVVYREFALGVVLQNGAVQILADSPLRGSTLGFHQPAVYPSADLIRPATLEDFDTYRVKYNPAYLIEAKAG